LIREASSLLLDDDDDDDDALEPPELPEAPPLPPGTTTTDPLDGIAGVLWCPGFTARLMPIGRLPPALEASKAGSKAAVVAYGMAPVPLRKAPTLDDIHF